MSTEAILSIFAGAVAALWAALTALWKQASRQHLHTQERLNACQEEHARSQGQIVQLTERVGRLEGREAGYTQARTDLVAAAKQLQQPPKAAAGQH